METYGGGRWNLYVAKIDLFEGLARLVDLQQAYGPRLWILRYEDLVREPERSVREVCTYLGVPFAPDLLTDFARLSLPGMGDQTGVRRFRTVSAEPLEKWRTTFANPVRKAWARRYLRWIGRERLARMGYDSAEMLHALDSVPASARYLGSDVLRLAYGSARAIIEPRVVRDKLLSPWTHVYNHP